MFAHGDYPPCDTPRARRCRVHRNPSLVRDDGQRPSQRDGMREMYTASGVSVKEYFWKTEVICPSGYFVAALHFESTLDGDLWQRYPRVEAWLQN